MKKSGKCVVGSVVIILILILSACGSSFEYDRDAAVKSAQELIETANAGDYQAVFDMLHEGVQSQVSAEILRDAWDPLISASGAFAEYEKATTTGVTQESVNYIVVVVPCKYENNTRTFTITYTEDLKVAALELK